MPRHLIAICLGNKSKVDKDKLQAQCKRFLPEDEVTFIPAPEGKNLSAEIIIYLVQKAPDAQLCVAVQGLADGEDALGIAGEELFVAHEGRPGARLGFIEATADLEEQLLMTILVEIEDDGAKKH